MVEGAVVVDLDLIPESYGRLTHVKVEEHKSSFVCCRVQCVCVDEDGCVYPMELKLCMSNEEDILWEMLRGCGKRRNLEKKICSCRFLGWLNVGEQDVLMAEVMVDDGSDGWR